LPQGGRWWRRWANYFWGLLATSGWLFAFTLPLILSRFGSISLMAIPANPLHITFMALLYMPLAMLVLSLSGLAWLLHLTYDEYWLYQALNALGKAWLWLLDQTAQLAPWGILHYSGDVDPWWMVLYWVLLAGVAWAWGKSKKNRRRAAARA